MAFETTKKSELPTLHRKHTTGRIPSPVTRHSHSSETSDQGGTKIRRIYIYIYICVCYVVSKSSTSVGYNNNTDSDSLNNISDNNITNGRQKHRKKTSRQSLLNGDM